MITETHPYLQNLPKVKNYDTVLDEAVAEARNVFADLYGKYDLSATQRLWVLHEVERSILNMCIGTERKT